MHLPVVVLLEIWHSCLCRCHDWLVVCDVLVLEDKALFCEDTYLVSGVMLLKVLNSCLCVGMIGVSVLEDKTLFCEDTYLLLVVVLMVVSHSCLRLRHICMSWSGAGACDLSPGPPRAL